MENFIYLMCTTPWEERCAQIIDDNYCDNARIEAKVYLSQLLRTLGEVPHGTFFKNIWCRHEFGQYLDIQFHYNDQEQQHAIYADKLERGVEKWDELARKELQAAGYALPLEKVIPIRRSTHYKTKSKGA
jgi:hypothetical protein